MSAALREEGTPLERAAEFSLASTLMSYPDVELEATVRDLAGLLAGHLQAGPFVAALAREEGFDGLRADYVELFDRGEARIPLYETEYGRMRGIAKGRDLADIAGFYRAFGLSLDPDRHEPVDHVAVEFEFYAVLLAKEAYLAEREDAEGQAIVQDARRKFLAEHLGPLAGVISSNAVARARSAYSDVLAWCGELVAAECAALGVTPAPLDFFDDEEDQSGPTCGAVRLPVV